MKTPLRFVSLLCALLCGGGAGWGLHAVIKRNEAPFSSAPQTGGALTAPSVTLAPSAAAANEPQGFFDRLHQAMGISNREKRQRTIAGLADNLESAQIRDALNRVAQSRIPDRKEVMAQLFAYWGELKPLAAIEFSKTLPRASDKREALVAILNGWMETESAAAENGWQSSPKAH